MWITRFYRLAAAVNDHRAAKHDLFIDETDEALYAAASRIVSDIPIVDR